MEQTVMIHQNRIPVTNLDKLFWTAEGITKADIMKYYAAVWPFLEPHLKDRPVSLVRYPEGVSGKFFYQKDVPDPPDWVATLPLASEDRVINYCLINNLETLIWSVNLGCIEVHPWLSQLPELENPTYVIIDLDPMAPADFNDTVRVAQLFKALLDELKLRTFPKISGATGIHIYLPLRPIYSFRQTSIFVKHLGELIIHTYPDLATNERKVAARAGKVYIDHLQNLKGKTIASVYSLRPFRGAPVAMPVEWKELPDSHPAMFTIETAMKRLNHKGDLFRPLLTLMQELPEEMLE